VVAAVRAAGAELAGVAVMDEMAYCLSGENPWTGTPPNPRAPRRVPGGSSSGSVAAVALGDVDFALGSDTMGSVRLPASNCGVLGYRPSHGRVSLKGAVAMAPSFDTVGWFARDAPTLRKVGAVLLSPSSSPPGTGAVPEPRQGAARLVLAEDALELCVPEAQQAVLRAIERMVPVLGLGGLQSARLIDGDPGGGAAPGGVERIEDCVPIVRTIQAREFWEEHGAWVKAECPKFGNPGVAERVRAAADVTAEECAEARGRMSAARAHLRARLTADGGAVIVVPGAADAAPLRGLAPSAAEAYRRDSLALTAAVGLGGLPQVNLPACWLGTPVAGGPLSVGLVGPHGSDELLLELAERAMPLFAPGPLAEEDWAT
jgi:amidase